VNARRRLLLLVACAAAAAACGRGEAAPAAEPATVALTLVHEHAAPLPELPGALATVASEPVVGLRDPRGEAFEVALRPRGGPSGHARRFGRITLELGMRSVGDDLGSYPCSSCHMGTGFVPGQERVEDAHQNVVGLHPQDAGSGCATCHAPEDVGLLVLHTGERVTLDHAYRLCGKCHFPDLTDWAAGSHGKRLDGWAGRRVVMGCADCHDPHQTVMQPRTPFPGPRFPAQGRIPR
jgi:hypothetical protein